MSNKIDDTKKCICNPALSGKNQKCLRCHPRKPVVIATGPRDFKHAQAKKHNGIKAGQLPWLQEAPETDTASVTTAETDPYADFQEA